MVFCSSNKGIIELPDTSTCYPLARSHIHYAGVAVTKFRIRLSWLFFSVVVAAIVVFIYCEYFRIYTDTGIYTDRYVERVVKKRLATLPDLANLTCEDIDKHLRIDSNHTVLLPSVTVCEDWGQDRIIISPSYVLQLRSLYGDLRSTWVSVTIERIEKTDFMTDRKTLEKYLPSDLIPDPD